MALEMVSEFSAAWCLSIVNQCSKKLCSISFDICLKKNGIHEDEKEQKKANLHPSNGTFVHFGYRNVFFKQLVMLWITKHSLIGKFT